jgi:hypothetical protein
VSFGEISRVFANLVGGDEARDKEMFFITLALEYGKPKPRKNLRVRFGGKKVSQAIRENDPDVHFVLRFAELAAVNHLVCLSTESFDKLYDEYEKWYEKNNPDVL